MPTPVPPVLTTSANQAVLAHLESQSAHSDIADALRQAVKPLGDVQLFCPDPSSYRYLVVSTRHRIFAFAAGMSTVAFRLDRRMHDRALATGAQPCQECGADWVLFTLFRDDWPRVDVEFWARKAYVAARE